MGRIGLLTDAPFKAAQGWLELGNLAEASAELERLEPQLRTHPDVLELRVKSS